MDIIKFLCDGSPRFKCEGEIYQAKPGFNEMPGKFTTDQYYDLCKKGGIIKDFISAPTDKQQEDFDKQIQAERERADSLQKELDKLKGKRTKEKPESKKTDNETDPENVNGIDNEVNE